MKTLITGAAGFLGTRLIKTLLADASATDRIVAADMSPCSIDDPRIDVRLGTITDASFVRSLVTSDVETIYHLAAVLSGQSEAEFDLGLEINMDATRSLLEACRGLPRAPRFVFSSTIAVFGGELPALVTEGTAVKPQSSYGTEKAIAELLVREYSRRGFIDGIACRVPTVAIRPGAPNSAMSSFVSGIIREPLAGMDTVCPVPLDTPLWISAPATVIANLAHAGRVPAISLGGDRTVNFPGLSVTPAEMLASLERLGGPAARARVRTAIDSLTERVVCTWPGAFDITRSRGLGFQADRDIDTIIRQFMAEPR